MGKIQKIRCSRKAYTCSKCRSAIAKGSPYYKGVINFHPAIIRCTKCGLKWYEVTTSEYIRSAGRIVEDWQEDFPVKDGVWEEIAASLQEIMDECSERLDNMPEQLQESENGQMLQKRVDGLEAAIEELENCSMEDFLKAAYEELTEEDQQVLDEAGDTDDFESWYKEFWKKDSETAKRWHEATKEAICNEIENILEEIPL